MALRAAEARISVGGQGSVELLETFGNDLTVVNAARVSLARESRELTARDARLIARLAREDHITPFFHPQARFRIRMPLYVAREWYRHTVGFTRSEVSRRYVSTMPDCSVPAPEEVRARSELVRQGSSTEPVPWAVEASALMREAADVALGAYSKLIEGGVAPEVARGVLPQSTYTEFIETASLYGYARLCRLRLGPDAQAEIRAFAEAVEALLRRRFPVSTAALRRSLGPAPRQDIPIIGIHGEMGAGKDTLADNFIAQMRGLYVKRRFAAGVREAAEILTGIPAARMYSDEEKAIQIASRQFASQEFDEVVRQMLAKVAPSFEATEDWRSAVPEFASVLCDAVPQHERFDQRVKPITVGRLLQLLGTECFRRCVGASVWVDYLFASVGGGGAVVIPDTRFENEAEAIRARGGVVVRVARPSAARMDGRSGAHPSEARLPPHLVDMVVVNDSTPGALGEQLILALPALHAIAVARE